jgi:hypothetical protein
VVRYCFKLAICCTAEAIALGFQHYLTVLGSSVMIPSLLVPMMGGDDVSFTFFLSVLHHLSELDLSCNSQCSMLLSLVDTED